MGETSYKVSSSSFQITIKHPHKVGKTDRDREEK